MFVRQRLSRLSRPSSLWCRYNSGLPPLPPLEEWKSRFPVHEIQGRVSLKNQRTADHVANAFLPEKEDGEGKVGRDDDSEDVRRQEIRNEKRKDDDEEDDELVE